MSPRFRLSLVLPALALAGPAWSYAPAAPAALPVVRQVWKPVRDGGEQVTAIEVRASLESFPDSTGLALVFGVPITYAGVPGIADRVEDLVVTDPSGAVPLRNVDDPTDPSGYPFFRHFILGRPVAYPVRLTYRSLAPTTPPRGPPFGLYSAWGGVSGAGSGFLVLPELGDSVRNLVHWDLSDLAAGSTAATSFGEGDFELLAPPGQLAQSWVMAGPMGRYPASGESGFTAFWLGSPSYDPDQEMAWAARMYRYLGDFYDYLRPLPSYRVFLRVGQPGDRFNRSGTALDSSFMAGAEMRPDGAGPEGEANRETLTHEMGHLFVGGIDEPAGVSSWFSEGLNTYYTRLLPMRGGFVSVDRYVRDVNGAFRTYYLSRSRNLSADSIARIGFGDEEVRHIPYFRGSLYFANLDSQIRAWSKGSRSLDVVLREQFVRRARGEPFDHAAWIRLVTREAGPTAAEEFEAVILRGDRTLVPAPDAFGPCLARQRAVLIAADGRRMAGYEWIRRAGWSDAACRRPH